MTVQQYPVKRMRLYEEPNGSFCTDHSGTAGDYIECPFQENTATYTMDIEMLPTLAAQQHIDGMSEEVLGRKTWTLNYTIPLASFTTKASDGVAAVQGAVGRMLKIALGGENLGTGDLFDVSAGTNAFDVVTGARWAAGGVIGCASGTGDALEVRKIESVSSNTITLAHSFSNTTVSTETAWNAATYYLETGGGDVVTSAQFLIEGLGIEDRFLFLGGQLASLAINAGPGTLPTLVFGWKGVDWDYADGTDTAGDFTGSTLGISTYTNANNVVVKDSEFRVFTNGTATLTNTLRQPPSYTFAPNLQYVEHRSPGGTETVYSWIRTHSPPVITGSWIEPFDDDLTWKLARDNRTDRAIWLQIGTSTTGPCVVIDVPTVQITDWKMVDVGGIQGQEISWKARQDSDVGLSVTDMALSAFRIHLL